MVQHSTATRSYRGVSQDDRRADRRARLMTAAIEVYGERGYRQASVKAVCDAAGLTERYFYESFSSSEALLIASYNAVTRDLFADIAQAAASAGTAPSRRSRAMLQAYFTALQRQPRSAQVFLVEIRGVSQAVDDAFNAALRVIAQQITDAFAARHSRSNELMALGIVGGISQIALHWIQQGYTPSLESVIKVAMKLGSGFITES